MLNSWSVSMSEFLDSPVEDITVMLKKKADEIRRLNDRADELLRHAKCRLKQIANGHPRFIVCNDNILRWLDTGATRLDYNSIVCIVNSLPGLGAVELTESGRVLDALHTKVNIDKTLVDIVHNHCLKKGVLYG
jgi:hypothetical protein